MLTLALLLNANIRGTGFYRTVYYLPSVVPTVAAVIVWIFIFETRRGILNFGLELLGLPTIQWLSDPNWAMPALIIMSLWTIGAARSPWLDCRASPRSCTKPPRSTAPTARKGCSASPCRS